MGVIKDFAYRVVYNDLKSYSLDNPGTAKEFQKGGTFYDYIKLSAGSEDYIGDVFAAIDVWGMYFAKAKFRLYNAKDKANIQEIYDHEALSLFKQPNNYQTWWEFAYILAAHFGLYGKAYFYKIRPAEKYPPIAYQVLLPGDVTPKRENGQLISYYIYKYEGRDIKIPREDIIEIRYPNPESIYDGYPIISSIADTVTVHKLQSEYSKKFYENGGFPGLLFTTDQDLAPKVFSQLLERLQQRFGGSKNVFKAGLLDKGAKPVQATHSMRDLEMSEQRRVTRTDVFAAFKVSEIMVGIGENFNKATADAAIYQFTSGVIDPILSYVDAVLSKHVQSEWGKDLIIEHDPLAPKDQEGQLKFIETGLKNGLLTINEGREIIGWNKFDFKLADVALVNVGGTIIRLDTGKQVAVETNTGNTNTPKSFYKAEDYDLKWKQFDRRLTLGIRRAERTLGKYFDDQERRILEALLNNYVVDQAFDLEKENLILYQLLEIDIWDIISGGYKYGDGLYNAGKFSKEKLTGEFNKILDSTSKINETTYNSLKGLSEESGIKKAYKEIKETRKEMIAVTTAVSSFNSGLLQAMVDAGLTQKTWLSSRDAKVRDYHKNMDGVTIPIDEPFEVEARGNKYLGMYPGDPTLGAVNNANERCTIIGKK